MLLIDSASIMNSPLFFLFSLGFVFLGFIWFGHFSVWGVLANKYKIPKIIRKENSCDYVNVGIRVNGKWKGGVYVACYYDGSGIVFETHRFIRMIMPSVYVPWNDVLCINKSKSGFMGSFRTEIKLKNDISILIPTEIVLKAPRGQ